MNHIIKNFNMLAGSVLRKQALLIAEEGYKAINTANVVQSQVTYSEKKQRLEICGYESLAAGSGLGSKRIKKLDLKKFDRVFCVGFGKAALETIETISSILKEKITAGFVIDLKTGDLPHHIISRIGTHPHPSGQNIQASKELLALLENLTERDLVLCAVSGGGSSLFTLPYDLSAENQVNLFKTLTKQGATITELNTVRKHTDKVKGGNLARMLFPATVISLVFSDVPGNDLGMVASGPTVRDVTTSANAAAILRKYDVLEQLNLPKLKLYETPKEERYFANVHNILLVSAKTALYAMKSRAADLGFDVKVFSEQFAGEAKELGKEIINKTKSGQCLIGAGESTVKITGQGIGGRNQEMALAALPLVAENQVLVCASSDGRDNTDAAGAIIDTSSYAKAKVLGLDGADFLQNNDSYHFFEQTGDLMFTGLTGSNVADFFVCIRL